jgi:hypothetical protein
MLRDSKRAAKVFAAPPGSSFPSAPSLGLGSSLAGGLNPSRFKPANRWKISSAFILLMVLMAYAPRADTTFVRAVLTAGLSKVLQGSGSWARAQTAVVKARGLNLAVIE